MRAFFRLASATLALAAAAVTVPGCSKDDKGKADSGEGTEHGDHDHAEFKTFCDLPASCQAIVKACHTKDDTKNAEIHECHETAHEGGEAAECDAVVDDCVAKCNAAPELGSDTELEECEGGAASDGG